MTQREKEVFIAKAAIFIVAFIVLTVIVERVAAVMIAAGLNTIVIAIPLALPFLALGVWITK